MILDRKKWIEFRPTGELWITGEIGVVSEYHKHLYDYRMSFGGYEGTPVIRLGDWIKFDKKGVVV